MRHTLGPPVRREQRDELARRSLECALARESTCTQAAPDQRVDLHAGIPLRSEEEQRRELVVEPAAVAGQHEDAPRRQRDRRVERELEIRRVLLLGMALDARRRALRDCDRLRRGRVEVADRDGRPRGRARARARAPCRPRPRARRAALRAQREDAAAPRPRPPPRSLPTRLPPLALPRSGSAGRRRVRPPSQPGLSRAPRYARGHRSARSRSIAGDDSAADPAEHRPARALPRHALRRPAARRRRRHDHARPRHRDRVRPRSRAGDLPHRRGARGAARWSAHGPLRPCPRARRADSSSGWWAAC